MTTQTLTNQQTADLLKEILPLPSNTLLTDRFNAAANDHAARCSGKCTGQCHHSFL